MNTKRTAVVFLCACMAFAFVAGCKSKQHVTTLQGTLFNAITGERIGGGQDVPSAGSPSAHAGCFLYWEKTLKSRDNSTIDLMGDYVFTNIPSLDNISADTTDPLSNEYRLTVIKEGFQRFEGIIDSDMLANKDNVIRNIYLFPEDFLIPCYTYTAKFNGKPVPGLSIAASALCHAESGHTATDKWLSIDLGGVVEGTDLRLHL